MKKRLAVLMALICCFTFILSGCSQKPASTSKALDYYPTTTWQAATPESQGMDSAELEKMLDSIDAANYQIDNIFITRNGYKVLDTSQYPFSNDNMHILNSITKSITSGCIGVAIDKKVLKGTDEKVLSIFPEKKVANPDDRKSAITIKDLLTMSGGFTWVETGNYASPDDSSRKMWASPDPVDHLLDLPMNAAPGEKFYYNTGISHLLSGIMTKKTGKPLSDFAMENLFTPLGIQQISWGRDAQGRNAGGSRLFMKPGDVAKYGLLYLNNGVWDGKQLISKDWIQESTRKQIETPNGIAGRDGYGFHWWMNSYGGYSGRGFQGQFLFVLPEQRIVAVFTGTLKGMNFYVPDNLMKKFVLPSIKSDTALAENTAAEKELLAHCTAFSSAPEKKPLPSLPKLAGSVSGKLYKMDNDETFQFDFKNGEEAGLIWTSAGYTYNLTLGLDGVYRNNTMEGIFWPGMVSPTAFRGSFTSDNVFELEYIPLEGTDPMNLIFTFSGKELTVRTESLVDQSTISEAKGTCE